MSIDTNHPIDHKSLKWSLFTQITNHSFDVEVSRFSPSHPCKLPQVFLAAISWEFDISLLIPLPPLSQLFLTNTGNSIHSWTKPSEGPSWFYSWRLGCDCVESKGEGDEGKGEEGEQGEGDGSDCVVEGGKGWIWERARIWVRKGKVRPEMDNSWLSRYWLG